MKRRENLSPLSKLRPSTVIIIIIICLYPFYKITYKKLGTLIVQTRAGRLPPIPKHREELKIQSEAEYFATNFEVF